MMTAEEKVKKVREMLGCLEEDQMTETEFRIWEVVTDTTLPMPDACRENSEKISNLTQ